MNNLLQEMRRDVLNNRGNNQLCEADLRRTLQLVFDLSNLWFTEGFFAESYVEETRAEQLYEVYWKRCCRRFFNVLNEEEIAEYGTNEYMCEECENSILYYIILRSVTMVCESKSEGINISKKIKWMAESILGNEWENLVSDCYELSYNKYILEEEKIITKKLDLLPIKVRSVELYAPISKLSREIKRLADNEIDRLLCHVEIPDVQRACLYLPVEERNKLLRYPKEILHDVEFGTLKMIYEKNDGTLGTLCTEGVICKSIEKIIKEIKSLHI